IVPTVPFLLVAAFCFARSNPEWERKILDHPQWGKQVRDWRERSAISRRTKVLSIASIAAGVGFTWLTLGFPWVWISVAVLIIVGGWIATRDE
ncbi:MAG: YbaN family protein, partial [Erythrobacter sp.]